MGHPTLLVPDGLAFRVLVEVRAIMRVKMLILHKSDFDYLLTFYPPPMERLRDELTDWAEVLRWISLPKVYAKKIRRIAQMNSGMLDTGTGGGGAGERRGSTQKNGLASVLLNSAGSIPALVRSSTRKVLGSARGKGGGSLPDEADRRKRSLNRGRSGQEKREKGRGRNSLKGLRAENNAVGSAASGAGRIGDFGGIGASPPEATPVPPADRAGLLSADLLPVPTS